MMQTEMRWYNFLSYVLVLIQFIALFFIGIILKNQGLKIQELEQDNQRIRQKLIETEARCQRLTDQCIYILAEGVWE